jgi:hypothetical protein
MPDPNHAVQEERGEREHHERMEQLQMGDLNAETSIEMSKQGSVEPMSVEPEDLQDKVENRSVEGDPRMPRIIYSPYTQHRDL